MGPMIASVGLGAERLFRFKKYFLEVLRNPWDRYLADKFYLTSNRSGVRLTTHSF